MNPIRHRQSFFEFDEQVDAFNKSFTSMIWLSQERFRSNYIAPENTQRFRHGDSWRRPANSDVIAGAMKEHSAPLNIPLNDIIRNDLGLLDRAFSHLNEVMQRQFADEVYSTISEACDASGNIVDAQKAGSLLDSFMAMFEKVEFGIDKNGNIHMPQVHAPPEIVQRMQAEVENAPPEFRERIEQLKRTKILEAIEQEAARKRKFVRYGE